MEIWDLIDLTISFSFSDLKSHTLNENKGELITESIHLTRKKYSLIKYLKKEH